MSFPVCNVRRFFSPSLIITGRNFSEFLRNLSNASMSGKHFNVHEVGCCIKYFIFGFNIIFWVSSALLTLCASCEWTVLHFVAWGLRQTHLWVSDTLAVSYLKTYELPNVLRQHCRTFQTRLWWPKSVERSKFTPKLYWTFGRSIR